MDCKKFFLSLSVRYSLALSTMIPFSHSYASTFAQIADLAGLQYDYQNKMYVTKINATQRFFGFNRISARAVNFVLDPDYSPENFDRKMDNLKDILKYTNIDVESILGFLKK